MLINLDGIDTQENQLSPNIINTDKNVVLHSESLALAWQLRNLQSAAIDGT